MPELKSPAKKRATTSAHAPVKELPPPPSASIEPKPEPIVAKEPPKPKAKLLPSDVGWQEALKGYQMRVLLTPENGQWTAHAKDMERVPSQTAPTQEEAIELLKVKLRERINWYLNRKPPEKPYFPCVVGVRTLGSVVKMILVRMEE